MGLLKRFIRHDLAELHANNVRVRVIGERDGLAPDIRALLDEAEELTRRQYRPDPGRRLQLWRPPGDRPGRAGHSPSRCRRGELDPDGDRRRHARRGARHDRHPRPRPRHPHLGRAAAVEFPALAERPTPNSSSCRISGPTSTTRASGPRSTSIAGASAASAARAPGRPHDRYRRALDARLRRGRPSELGLRVASSPVLGRSSLCSRPSVGGWIFALLWLARRRRRALRMDRHDQAPSRGSTPAGRARRRARRACVGERVRRRLAADRGGDLRRRARCRRGARPELARPRLGRRRLRLRGGDRGRAAARARAPAASGSSAILWMFAVVWLTDIAAYFTGRRFGGPKLWPRVSPKKTWSGFLGGLVARRRWPAASSWLVAGSARRRPPR